MRLRIGLVTSEFPPDLGGVETYSWQLACELGRRHGFEVTVYAPVRAAAVHAPAGVAIKPILSSCRALDWCRLQDEPVDVWHALAAGHAWLALTGRPTVVSAHGNDFLVPYPATMRPALAIPGAWRLRAFIWKHLEGVWRRRTDRMLTQALPRCGAIFANSRYTAGALLQVHPACSATLSVAGVGVDAAFFEVQRAASSGRKRLLTVSRLSEPRKNVDLVLRALARLVGRYDFEYVVVGDGHLRPGLERLAGELGLGARVRFMGAVPNEELYRCYAQADLFVLAASINPKSHEGFGIVYLEAAAAGVPSLAARLAGAVEAVQEGVSGYFVDTPAVDEIAVAIDEFLSGRRSFDEETCRAFARQHSWAHVVDIVVDRYEHMLAAPSVAKAGARKRGASSNREESRNARQH